MDDKTTEPNTTPETSDSVPDTSTESANDTPHVIEAAPIHEEHETIGNRFWGIAKIITIMITGIAIVVLFNLYVVQVFKVDGESMDPTLQSGNIMVLWKTPRTWARITGKQYIPKRWDVVVVRNDRGEQYIKRVIGLAGDRVIINDGQLLIINDENPSGFNPNDNDCCRQLAPTAGNIDRYVNDGELFVIGDNREPAGSIDSRSGLGNIPAAEVVGKVTLRLSPLSTY